jgi:hypothetical protein
MEPPSCFSLKIYILWIKLYKIRATNISQKALSDTSTVVCVYMHALVSVLSLPTGQYQDEWLISCLANDVTNWRNVKMFSPFHKNCVASF